MERLLEPLLETIEKYPDTADVVLEYLNGILLAQDKRARTAQQLASMSEAELQEALTAVNMSLQELVLQPFCAENIVAYARQMRNFWRHDFLPALQNIDVPILFIGGDCDRIASQALAKVIAGLLPQARSHIPVLDRLIESVSLPGEVLVVVDFADDPTVPVVERLNGAPGLYSALFGKPGNVVGAMLSRTSSPPGSVQ